MVKRIFRSICFVAFTVFTAALVLIMGVLYTYFSNVQQSQLKTQTMLAAQGVSHEGAAYFEQLEPRGFRVTWIDEAGNVLYDSRSDPSEMENHLEREEIQEAFRDGFGESRRYSATLMERLFYCAQLLEDGTVIRLSAAQYTVLSLVIGMAQPICLIILVAIVLSVALAIRLSRKIVEPLNQLDLDDPLGNSDYDELSPLLRRIAAQQTQLKGQQEQLRQKQKELDTIVGNMKEGMILLSQNGTILSINPSARRLLETDKSCVGEDILVVSRNLGLQEVFARALKGEAATRTVTLGGGSYQVDASPVVSETGQPGTQVSGVAVLLLDVTEKEKAEQMRREFTANVSHELKTPLHAISGYAELLKSGLAGEKDVVPFAGKIYTETQRMIRLVEDIISLSHLDEGGRDMGCEEVDLYALAGTVIAGLEPEGAKRGILLELSGETAVIKGNPQLLHSILYNLCDNGIKYNREGGRVVIEVKPERTGKDETGMNEAGTEETGANKTGAVVSVKDTGIGIEREDQERIFERFYRVDKSHSKAVGGTGLGLSIVKHAARVHGAKIQLNSVVGEGTEVTVRFPPAKDSGL